MPDPIKRFYSDRCLVCGRDNPIGYRCVFHTDGESAWTEAVAPKHFEGFGGVVHGGLVSALLDEAMWYGIYVRGFTTMTVHLDVTLRRSLKPEMPIKVSGRLAGQKRRYYLATAEMTDETGVLAQAKGRFLQVPKIEAHLQGTIIEERVLGE